MYCPNCGKKVEGKFCCYCGHPLPVITESPSEEFRTQEELEKNLEKNLDSRAFSQEKIGNPKNNVGNSKNRMS